MTTEPRRPRLLLVSHSYRPERTPPARRWGAVVAALRSAGWDVDVVAPGGVRPFAGPDGERVLPTPRLPLGEAGRNGRFAEAVAHARLAVPRGMATRRPDVVVATVPALPVVVPGVVLSRLWRRPLVLEMRDAWPDLLLSAAQWSEPAACPSALAWAHRARRLHIVDHGTRSLLPPLITRLEREAAAVVTTTDSFAQVLRSRGVRRVVTVRNTGAAVQTGRTGADRRRSDGILHVLYLGTVGRAQGLSFAVRAAHIAQRNGTPVVLRIVGDGAQLQEAAALAHRLAAPVEILPPVPWSEVAEHYAWADTALVSLQDWPAMSVTVPSKLYEIMSAGVHVCASVDGEARRIVEDAGCGDVTAPQDSQALASLWSALAADRSRLDVTGGRRWLADHADAEAMTDRYESLLRQVAGG